MVRINAKRVRMKVELKGSGAQLEIPVRSKILFNHRGSKPHLPATREFLTPGGSWW